MAGEPEFNDKPYGILEPARDAVAVTPGPSGLTEGPCRALLLDAADTVTIVTMAGREVSLPLQAGFNPIMCRAVKSVSGAANVYALY